MAKIIFCFFNSTEIYQNNNFHCSINNNGVRVMRFFFRTVFSVILFVMLSNSFAYSSSFIPANNPFIQYFGRWDTSDSLHPCQSWPGVYICAEFTGRTIGIKTNDTSNYYNVVYR